MELVDVRQRSIAYCADAPSPAQTVRVDGKRVGRNGSASRPRSTPSQLEEREGRKIIHSKCYPSTKYISVVRVCTCRTRWRSGRANLRWTQPVATYGWEDIYTKLGSTGIGRDPLDRPIETTMTILDDRIGRVDKRYNRFNLGIFTVDSDVDGRLVRRARFNRLHRRTKLRRTRF